MRCLYVMLPVALCLSGPPGASAQREHKHRATSPPATRPEHRAPAPGWEGIESAGFAAAAQAAHDDALDQLAKRIGGLRIATGRVADYISTNAAFGAAIRTPFPGVTLSRPRYARDQIATVRATVQITQVIAELKRLNHRLGRGRLTDRDFDRMPSLNPIHSITVVGQGVPALAHIPRAGRRPVGVTPSWVHQERRATGTGEPPASRRGTATGKLMAASRARSDARRKLALDIRRLTLPGGRGDTVGARIDRHPELAHAFDKWLRETRAIETSWTATQGAIVVVQADLESLWRLITPPGTIRHPQPPARSPINPPHEQKRRPSTRP